MLLGYYHLGEVDDVDMNFDFVTIEQKDGVHSMWLII